MIFQIFFIFAKKEKIMEKIQSLVLSTDKYVIGAFIGYLLLIVLLGIYAAKFSSRGIGNYFIGGRKMSTLVVALSAVVSGRSAWLLLGVTGMAYTMGLSAIWAAAGYTISEFFLFYFYAPRLRRFSEKCDCITITDFYAERFRDKTGSLRILVVIIIILFMIAYVSAQFVAGGKTFSSAFQITESNGMFLTAIIILFYTIVGGFLAVSLTDTIQGFIMIAALLLLPSIAVYNMGGFSEFWSAAVQIDGGSFMGLFALSGGMLIGFLGIGLGSAGNPHIVARYMSIKDSKKLAKVAYIGTITNILMAVGAVFVGIAGRIYFPELIMLPDSDPENIYPLLAANKLHPIFLGIITSSIFAAIMSTADSQLLVAASAVVRDIYQKILRKNCEIPEKRLIRLSRIVVLCLVLAALLLGFYASELVFWLVLFAWAGLGAAFGPTSILAIFWKGCTKAGVSAGIITGAATVIIWKNVSVLQELVYELIPGFFLAFIVTVIVSLLTKKPENCDEIVEKMKN